MSVHKGLLDAIKGVETLMEIIYALVMRDTKYIMMIEHIVLVSCN